MTTLSLLFAASVPAAEDWLRVIRRSHRMSLIASIDLAASGTDGLDAALAAHPRAAVAVFCAGPREASRIAERLARHEGPSVLYPTPARPCDGPRVQIAQGWLTLSGVGALERLLAPGRAQSVRLAVRGLPEGPARGLGPALTHAAGLVARLGREVEVRHAVLATEELLQVSLRVDAVPWELEVAPRGQSLELVARTGEGDYAWIVDGVSETLRRPRAEARAIPAAPWAERCLRQLEAPARGASLKDAERARAIVDAVEAALERPLPPDRVVVGSLEDGLGPLGLSGELPLTAPLAPLAPPRFDLPIELTSYALGLKPAVFLTVAPQDEARVRALLPGHVERVERRVEVGPGDRWLDDRARGEPRIELYAARDPDALRRLVQLQTSDPSLHLGAIGALLGYPACCVQAFASLGDRSDNGYNRIAAAARTSVGGPWPALLDDTSLKLLPHFPCTYRCERSLDAARALLEALADEAPALHRAVRAYLGGPVLYFDHDHQLRFRGEATGGGVRYTSVAIPWSRSEPFAALAGAIAEGDRLTLGDDALIVHRGEATRFVLARTDPHLGVLMPFSARAD
ncbi:MAG: hypothetical protein KF729_27210 [Sandaracinaceae bacterium]|nr:hypothetical protein [Sandaracinaceae bacterium]